VSIIWLLLMLVLGLLLGTLTVRAQVEVAVQDLNGFLDLGGEAFHRLPAPRAGVTVYVHVSRTSGNLDPGVGLADTRLEAESLSEARSEQVAQTIAGGQDPQQASTSLPSFFSLRSWPTVASSRIAGR
jgi:hypothetical protein